MDDILCVDHCPAEPMGKLGSIYRMKEGSVGPPTMYLGANVRKWTVQDYLGQDIPCYAMGSHGYVKESIRIVEGIMHMHDLTYSSTRQQGRNTPFSSVDY